MRKNDLRVSRNITELSKDIKAILGNNEGFTIWQNINGEKEVIPGVINSQFLSSSELTLEFEITDSQKIKPKTKIFMFCDACSMLLKGRIKVISKSKMKVIIDHKFYLKEKRTIPRTEFGKNNIHGSIERKIELKNTTKTEDVRLKNISCSGCGFYISANRAIFFQPGSEINIESIEGIYIPEVTKGLITHITPVDVMFDSNKLMLVGVKFLYSVTNIDIIMQDVMLKLSQDPASKLSGKLIG